jgi:PEP-CTERM motif-containing protein
LKRLSVVATPPPAVLVAVATPSQAEVLTLTSAGNTISNGIYIGPYTLKASDGSIFSAICDDFQADTYIGEVWSATVSSFSDLTNTKFANPSNSYMGVTGAEGYSMAGWLATQLFAMPGNADIQFALWHVFDASSPLYGNSASLLQTAYQQHRFDSPALYANLVIFSPIGPSCVSGCSSWPAQEFIALTTPEPASLSLLGLGASALIAARRRRRGRSAA